MDSHCAYLLSWRSYPSVPDNALLQQMKMWAQTEEKKDTSVLCVGSSTCSVLKGLLHCGVPKTRALSSDDGV